MCVCVCVWHLCTCVCARADEYSPFGLVLRLSRFSTGQGPWPGRENTRCSCRDLQPIAPSLPPSCHPSLQGQCPHLTHLLDGWGVCCHRYWFINPDTFFHFPPPTSNNLNQTGWRSEQTHEKMSESERMRLRYIGFKVHPKKLYDYLLKLLLFPTDFHSMEKIIHILQNVLYVQQKKNSYRFGTTWGRINSSILQMKKKNFGGGWTVPLKEYSTISSDEHKQIFMAK